MRDCDTEIKIIDADWTLAKNRCRTTVNKKWTDNAPNRDFIKALLISEHSPIRAIRVAWRWDSIKSWVATHFSRHWVGWLKWIGTRRSDRTGIDRGELSQNELVPMEVDANAQALINVSRFRLCFMASNETREYMEDLKRKIKLGGEDELSYVMVPNCIYRGGCPEFHTCGFWEKFKSMYPDIDYTSIQARYDAYEESFYHG